MANANEFVVDAMEDIVVQADEAPIEQSEGRAAMRILNDMMFMWAARGVYLGYTNVDNLGDEVTVPDGAIMGIKAHLAIMLADKYDVPVSASLALKASQGWEAILNIAINTDESQYPSTLPQGSGNTSPSFANNTFYVEKY